MEKIIVGKFASVFGVKGWIKVISYTDPPENLFNYADWFVKHNRAWQPINIEAAKPHGKAFVVKIQDIDDRDIAHTYTNNEIAITRDALPDLPEGEYYWSQLVGLTVTTTEGVTLGTIVRLDETGANDIIFIRGDRERVLPYIDSVVKNIDLDKQQMIVDWDPDF